MEEGGDLTGLEVLTPQQQARMQHLAHQIRPGAQGCWFFFV